MSRYPPLKNHPARLAALAAGENTFTIDSPCNNGHNSPRYTFAVRCVACEHLRSINPSKAHLAARKRCSKKRSAARIAARVARQEAHFAEVKAQNKALWATRKRTAAQLLADAIAEANNGDDRT
jgi:Na+-translocating ferredoxin:NAD+ oxidoreductase RnfC subunit